MMFFELLKETNFDYQIEYLNDINSEIIIEEDSNELLLEDFFLKNIYNKVKEYVKKFIKWIKSIWKKFIEMVKKFIQKIKEWVNKLLVKDKISSSEPIYATFCMESSYLPDPVKYNDIDHVIKAYKRSMYNIEKKMNEISGRNIKISEMMKKYQISRESIESYAEFYNIIMEDIEEMDVPMQNLGSTKPIPGVILQSSDILSQVLNEKREIFSKEKFERIRQLQGKMEEFYEYLSNGMVDGIMKLFEENSEYLILDKSYTDNTKNAMLNRFYTTLKTIQFDRPYFKKLMDLTIAANFPKTDEGFAALKAWIKIQYDYNNSIMEVLSNMIVLNYEMLKISLSKANEISFQLKKDWNTKELGIVLRNNLNQFISSDNRVFDFSKLGLGILLNSHEIAADEAKNSNKKFLDFSYSDTFLNNLTKYDVMIQAHESSEDPYITINDYLKLVSPIENNLFKTLYNKEYSLYYRLMNEKFYNDRNPEFKTRLFMNKYLKAGISNKHITDDYFYMTYCKPYISNKSFRKFLKDYSNGDWHRWILSSPVTSYKSNNDFYDVELLCWQLYNEGFKRILLLICNTHGYQIHPNISNLKGITIRKTRLGELVQ